MEKSRTVNDRAKGLHFTSPTVTSRPVRSRAVSMMSFFAMEGTTKNPTSPYNTTAATSAERQLSSFQDAHQSPGRFISAPPRRTKFRGKKHPRSECYNVSRSLSNPTATVSVGSPA